MRIYKFLTHFKTQRYVDVLDDLVKAYNMSPHRGLKGLSPYKVHFELSTDEIHRLHVAMYSYNCKASTNHHHNLAVSQTVRIASTARQNIFKKSYKVLNTEEILRIYKINTAWYKGLFS